MTLVKLDSGDYINTDAVDSIKSEDDPYLVMRCGDVIIITTEDRDRIVGAMGNQQLSNLIKRWEATVADLASDMNDPCDRVEHSTMNMCLRELKVAIQ